MGHRAWLAASLVCGAAAVLGGCDASGRLAEWAVDNGEAASVESALLAVVTETADPGGTEAQAAAAAAAAAVARLGNCVTASAAGPTVTYEMTDCGAPNGLLVINGTAEVTFQLVPVSMGATLMAAGASSTNLDINGGLFTLDAGGLMESTGPGRTLIVTTNSTGSTARGHELTRRGTYVVIADDAGSCVTLDGTWQTFVGDTGWDTSATAYGKCLDACPDSGGIIEVGGPNDRGVTVSFDGTTAAAWESRTGRTGTVALNCP